MKTASAARKEAAGLFRDKRSLYYYSLTKIATDPAYRFVAGALAGSRLPLLDVGCGTGLLTGYLRALGQDFPVIGIDTDETKITLARERIPGAEFLAGSALTLPPHSGNVVILDVLHYLDQSERRHFFQEVARRVAPEGAAYIRFTLRDGSWRFLVTLAEEWFVSSSGWIPVRGRYFPSKEDIGQLTGSCGMKSLLEPMWGYTPFNSYMLELRHAPIPTAL